jgi:mRNA-degrading endonuclease RelE of RelBE toxin-antitoxin system
MHSFFYSDRFERAYRKLDPHKREMVKKKILKIAENPLLGKPLHNPLQHYRSERIENMRIVYTIVDDTIQFVWMDDRKDVYQ